ncbi:MAG: methionyl-tRNA formyltransferase [Gemmatimonadota bacterium]
MRVVFWGTPEFALASLLAVESEGHHIAGVVTQPDRPAGRGRKLTPSPVRARAEQEGYRVFTPERPRGDDFLYELSQLQPDVFVVVAYGHILRPEVLDLPPRGCINVHASLLPELRGAAPIHRAIARGDERTGVTIMRLVPEMDAGPILHQAEERIGPSDTTTVLSARLAELGAELLVETLALLEAGMAEEREQDHTRATFAPKIDRATARIDWSRPASELDRHVRAMDQAPGAWTELDAQPLKLFTPVPSPDTEAGAPPGTVVIADPQAGLVVACGEGRLGLREVQPAGRARMPALDWLRGRGVEAGQRFQ